MSNQVTCQPSGAKALLLATADERKGLKRLQEKNDELAHALEDQSNIHALNDIHLMRQFYDDVTTGSARVDARIRAVESVQWLDLHDKYGIRRQHLLGESRNMKALEEKAMRANAMAALRHYLGEFQVKKIRSQLESADAWFGAQERRLKEEVLMLNADGSRSVAEVQRSEQIDAALRNENLDPNLSSVFTRRGKTLAEASARVYQSFAVWAGQAKAQLEQTKLESAAAAKHLKNRLMSAEVLCPDCMSCPVLIKPLRTGRGVLSPRACGGAGGIGGSLWGGRVGHQRGYPGQVSSHTAEPTGGRLRSHSCNSFVSCRRFEMR